VTFRNRVEDSDAGVIGSVRNYLTDHPIGRVFSLRQDFSSAFTRLLHSPAATEVRIEISDRHFPIFIANHAIQVTASALLLRASVDPGAFQISIDGAPVNGFVADQDFGDLAARPLPGVFTNNLRGQHTLSVEAAGSFAPPAPAPGDTSAIDADRLLDMLLYIEYTVPPA
jgi:hypothetical protein